MPFEKREGFMPSRCQYWKRQVLPLHRGPPMVGTMPPGAEAELRMSTLAAPPLMATAVDALSRFIDGSSTAANAARVSRGAPDENAANILRFLITIRRRCLSRSDPEHEPVSLSWQ